MKRKLFSPPAVIVFGTIFLYFFSSFVIRKPAIIDPALQVQLGSKLFADPILSGNGMVSCASCHKPEFAFADDLPLSLGVNAQNTARNTPTAMYQVRKTNYFWDGRAHSLEEQAKGPITNPKEMNGSIQEDLRRLRKNKSYDSLFLRVYGNHPDSVSLLKAIAAFENSLAYYDSPYDRFLKGDDSAMSPAAIRGFRLFFRKNSCSNEACHHGVDFSSDSMVNIGIYSDKDRGLADLTKRPEDIGRFKSPTLRNIALTAPYMHDGSHKTLREVIDYYNDMKHFPINGNTHPDVKEQGERPMSEQSINDLIAFLESLTDYRLMNKKPH
ncbi:MAG TPA: cytochrome c peroxidase [Puia sp.]|uniref:cytochrome-c peroxidase n=1 Tax=Puia sp. TaxID=2045100 RepID=UPI002B69E565|nr:cytochrome c peroxidase [Puia sp.]HVU94513.1 cytochrome c peroxidase [Puia sp.]